MFRLKEQQLHMILFLMTGATLVLFFVFGIKSIPKPDARSSWKGIESFSEGWICTYDTLDIEKLEAYQKKQGQGKTKGNTIVEVLSLPAEISVKPETKVTMLHKVPDMDVDAMYLTIESDNQDIKVIVDGEVLYANDSAETMLSVRHVIPIPAQYKEKTILLELYGYGNEEMKLGKIQCGTYNQMWVSLAGENGASVVLGSILICMSFCMLIVWKIMKNTWQQKRLLIYSTIEGMILGGLLILSGEFVPFITGWHVGVYILRACLILMEGILHLLIIRCFTYKKKVLTVVDCGVLLIGIFFVSVMVLQAFSLVQYDTIYNMGLILSGICVVIYTIVLAITIFDYKRREGIPVFTANLILILGMLMQVISHFMGREMEIGYLYIQIGIFIYMIYIWIFGLKQAFYVQPKKEEIGINEDEIRKQVVEQLNPNLLFASFQTLQKLIKGGSSNSVKMIYYISVYIRDNLKALEKNGEVVSFEEELEHIIAYLQLQKMRNHNLDFLLECKVKEFQIPRHSIVPIVENAVKYGIADKGSRGNVVIRSYMRSDGYAIQIIDDGVGFDINVLRKNSPTSLLNLFDMLEQMCKARTEVISKKGKGTVVTIILPVLENELMDKNDMIEG